MSEPVIFISYMCSQCLSVRHYCFYFGIQEWSKNYSRAKSQMHRFFIEGVYIHIQLWILTPIPPHQLLSRYTLFLPVAPHLMKTFYSTLSIHLVLGPPFSSISIRFRGKYFFCCYIPLNSLHMSSSFYKRSITDNIVCGSIQIDDLIVLTGFI